MFFDNLEVNHKSFGKGTVISQQGKYITVRFGGIQKIFVYPEAFENFLTLADGTVPDEIMIDIEAAKHARQIIIDKQNEENIRAMTKGIVIPGKESVIGEGEDEENSYKSQETDAEDM